jgi:hypothetical protein
MHDFLMACDGVYVCMCVFLFFFCQSMLLHAS